MKISKLLHIVSILVGGIGVVTFMGSMIGGGDDLVFGVTKMDALMCSAILILIAIWAQVGTMHHMMLEKTGELI